MEAGSNQNACWQTHYGRLVAVDDYGKSDCRGEVNDTDGADQEGYWG